MEISGQNKEEIGQSIQQNLHFLVGFVNLHQRHHIALSAAANGAADVGVCDEAAALR